MPDGYLPPVVALLGADASPFIAKLREAKALLADWGKSDAQARLGLDTSEAFAKFQALSASLSARGISVPLRLDVDTASAVAKIAGLKLATGGATGGGGGGLGNILRRVLWGGGHRRGRWGRLFGGLAGFGSLGSLAGFGPEHVLMTGVGLAGSAAAGAAGGGLLASGSLGKLMVGGGSDMLVNRTTLNNVKGLVSDYNQLNTAIARYGAGSRQAAAAQRQLNSDIAELPPAAAAAEVGLAQAWGSLKEFWQQATAQAQSQSAQLMQSVLGVARTFIPLIGNAANRNISIIRQAIAPLFAWLQGPMGQNIFQDLENQFAGTLPTSIHAFSQAFELVIKTMDVASHYTGQFITKIDQFLTRTNSATGFAKWSAEIGHLIAIFHEWAALIRAAGRDLYLLFHADAGTASAIVQSLTQMLQKLGDWMQSTTGQKKLHSVFETHKQEIQAMLKILPSLVSGFGKMYMQVAPALTQALTTVLGALAPIISAVASDPFGAWAVGLALISGKLLGFSTVFGGIKTAFTALQGVVAPLITKFFGLGAAQAAASVGADAAAAGEMGVGVGADEAAAGVTALDVASGGLVLAILALVAGVIELLLHWKTVWPEIKRIAVGFWHGLDGDVIQPIKHFLTKDVAKWTGDVGGFFARGWTDIKNAVVTGWQAVDTNGIQPIENFFTKTIPQWTGDVGKFFSDMWSGVEQITGTAVGFLIGLLKNAFVDPVLAFFGAILTGADKMFGWVPGVGGKLDAAKKAFDDFKTQVDGTLTNIATDATNWGNNIGQNLGSGLVAGIQSQMGAVTAAAKVQADQVVKMTRLQLKTQSPSRVFMEIGRNVGLGLLIGMQNTYASHVLPFVSTMGRGMAGSMSLPGVGGGRTADRGERLLTEILNELRKQTRSGDEQTRIGKQQINQLTALHGQIGAGIRGHVAANNAALVAGLRAGSVR